MCKLTDTERLHIVENKLEGIEGVLKLLHVSQLRMEKAIYLSIYIYIYIFTHYIYIYRERDIERERDRERERRPWAARKAAAS